MKLKRGLKLRDKNSGRIITLKREVGGNGHWDCVCGKKNHKIHKGTLEKFYEENDDE